MIQLFFLMLDLITLVLASEPCFKNIIRPSKLGSLSDLVLGSYPYFVLEDNRFRQQWEDEILAYALRTIPSRHIYLIFDENSKHLKIGSIKLLNALEISSSNDKREERSTLKAQIPLSKWTLSIVILSLIIGFKMFILFSLLPLNRRIHALG